MLPLLNAVLRYAWKGTPPKYLSYCLKIIEVPKIKEEILDIFLVQGYRIKLQT